MTTCRIFLRAGVLIALLSVCGLDACWAGTYRDAVLGLKPSGLWMLDEEAAPVVDSTGHCLDSIIATGTFGVEGPPGLPRAVMFDGASQYVRIPYAPSMKLAPSFWWCGWIKFTSTQKRFPGVFERGLSSKGHYGLKLWVYGADAGAQAGVPTWHRNGAQVGWDSVVRPVDTTWKFYCLVFEAESNSIRLYVNGQPTSQASKRPAFNGNDEETGDLFLACQVNGAAPSNFFKGSLAGIAYGNGTLTPAQIRAVYEAAAGPLATPQIEGGISTGDMIYYVDDDAHRVKDFALIKGLNAKWVRYDFNWKVLEPTAKGAYDWSLPDTALKLAKANELETLGVVLGVPGWANGQQGMFHPPAKATDFRDFCYALGLRYIPQGVTAWEIGNEVNAANFWQPKPDSADYVNKYLIPGAAGLRAAVAALGPDIKLTIISAGLTADKTDATHFSPIDFLTGIYANGGKSSFDAVALHPYTYPYSPWWPAGWVMRAPELYAVMVANDDGAKNIWATECGYHTTTGFTGVIEEFQAAFAEQLIRIWQDFAFAGPLFWYKHRDSGANKNDIDQMGGLVRFDFTEKPAAGVARAAFASEAANPP